MKRVHVLVEGQTEETFVRDLLLSHLHRRGIHLTPIIAATKRVKDGRKFRGGIVSFGKLRRDLERLLADSSAVAVTTMIDFYGLPRDFPGVLDLPASLPATDRVQVLESSLLQALGGTRRFLPYLSLHEFEALLLTSPETIEATLRAQGAAEELARIVAAKGSPEEVNDGEETHPSARIQRVANSYRKALHGPIIAERIGLDSLRRSCLHFAGWLGRLESLAVADP